MSRPDPDAIAHRFPPDFRWGAATASYQIEGSVHADGRLPSVWDTFSHAPGRVANGDTGDVACDHYRRWADDVGLMADLGLDAYRFSVAWPRVMPDGDRVNPAGLDFYDRLVDGLLERGIEPWLTLYHWDLPQVLEDAGGWREPAIVERFVAYADAVAGRLGDRVRHWITLNEPQVFAILGHALGIHAPGMTDYAAALRVAHHAHLAHAAGMAQLRQTVPAAQVGLAASIVRWEPATGSEADAAATRRMDGFSTRWFLDPVVGRGYPSDAVELLGSLTDGLDLGEVAGMPAPDFIGLNYYTRELVIDAPAVAPLRALTVRPDVERTAMAWEVHPAGLRELLLRLHREYDVPRIVVTENGSAWDDVVGSDGSIDDPDRIGYLAGHLEAVADARDAGAPVDGYFAWSLLDNFEWAEGYAKRFGIVHVDFDTQARTMKASGGWYADLIRASRGGNGTAGRRAG